MTVSLREAASWYQRAVDKDLDKARYKLARLYRLGRGVPRNLERARALYEQAAEGGLIAVQLSLAMLYEAGQAWPKDTQRSIHWYRTAAAARSADAQVNLAYLYAEGVGVDKVLIEAYAWYYAAQTHGHPLGADNLKVIEQMLSAEHLARGQALGRRYAERSGMDDEELAHASGA